VSTFKVEKTKIAKIIPIEGADKVQLAQVDGMTFQFVVGKDQFKVGDDCVFFPIDSILPQPLIDHFGIAKFLSGKDHNRVKTAKFLKQISQGYVSTVESVHQYLVDRNTAYSLPDQNDYTEALGVTKYEAPAVLQKNARLIPLDMKAYDIEGCDRNQAVVDYLMDKDVVITEKVEGMNLHMALKADGSVRYGQRNFYIESNDPEQPHSFEAVAKVKLLPLANAICEFHKGAMNIRIRAEFLGESSQGNYYSFKGHRPMVFEIDIEGHPVDAIDLLDMVETFGIDFVPVLFKGKLRDFLNGQTVQEASNGQSKLVNKLREGIVIRPFHEEYSEELGSRLIIKQRSPQYLAKTEY
jgi:RNA ligase (TIGR02306 family)